MANDPSRALVRRLPCSYVDYYARQGRTVSAPLADAQHLAYASALKTANVCVSYVEEDESLPDCVFIEDTAVVWGQHALITRMFQDREGEQAAVEANLRQSHSISRVSRGATLEGGDVLHIDNTTYVGLSVRTNDAGVESLRAFLAPFGRRVVTVPVGNCLHLKTGVTYLGNGTLLAVPDWFDLTRFEVNDVIYTENDERGAANCLRVRDHLLTLQRYIRSSL